MHHSWVRVIALFASAIVVLLALRIPGWLRSIELTPSAWAAAFWFALLALVVICLAWVTYKALFPPPHEAAQFAQGLGAVVTIVAIFVAAGIYFLERRDKPRLSPTLSLNAIRLSGSDKSNDQVLLIVRLAIKNEGQRQVEIRCMSLALLGVKPGQKILRVPPDSEEMSFFPISDPINYTPGQACNSAEEKRRGWSAGKVRPLYRWGLALRLEPGESDDRYFEMPVDCDYALLRVLAKFRINPEDPFGYEVKDMISVAKVCAGDREIASGIADAPAADRGAVQEPAASAAEPAGNAF